MYLLTDIKEPDPTRAALLKAGLELLAEKGYKGATTRAIAQKAQVSEVTLFRHFANKEELMREAINRLEPPIEHLLPNPSPNLEADLEQFVGNVAGFLQANQGFVIRLLSELLRHPELRMGPAAGFARTLGAGRGFIERIQQAGWLTPDERPEQMVIELIGPLMAKVLMSGAWGLEIPFDVQTHIRGFLHGRKQEV